MSEQPDIGSGGGAADQTDERQRHDEHVLQEGQVRQARGMVRRYCTGWAGIGARGRPPDAVADDADEGGTMMVRTKGVDDDARPTMSPICPR